MATDIRAQQRQVLMACRERHWAALETGISRPVPEARDGQINLWYLLYRSLVCPPKQILYEPYARLRVAYETGEIVERNDLPVSDPPRVAGYYPHAEVEALSREMYDALWHEYYTRYPAIIVGFTGGDVAPSDVERFQALRNLLESPHLKSWYEALNPAFFEWLGWMSQPFTPAAMLPRLQNELGYSADGASAVSNRIIQARKGVQAAFWRWWWTGEMALTVEGYTPDRLVWDHGLTPIAAFLTLDWLLRDPDAAKISLASAAVEAQ